MSSDNEITSRLVFETDTAGLNASKKAIRSLSNDLDDMNKAQEAYAKKQRDIAEQRKRDIAFEKEVRSQSFDSPKSGANAGGGDAGFGKLEAGINALSGLSNGIDVGSIVGAADGVLDVTAGLKNLPSAFSGILSIVNPVTIGLAAVTLAFVAFLDQANKQAEQLNKAIEARRSALQFSAEGGTSADASSQVETLRRRADAEKKLLAELEAQYKAFEEQAGFLSGVAKVIAPQEESLLSQINQSREAANQYELDIKALEEVMNSAEVAANDYAQAILQQSELVKQAVITEFEANERTGEQNRERLRQINVQIEATQAQLEVLQNAETQSTETTAKIAELEAQLKGLGQEADITSRFTEKTSKDIENANKERADAEKKSAEDRTRAVEESARKQQEAIEQQAQALENLNNRIVDLALANADKEEDANRQLNDSRSDARRKLADDLKKLDATAREERQKFILDTQADEAKNAREHARNLEKIQKDAQRQREDLARNLDFAGLFDLESNLNDQLSDAQSEYDAQRQERQLAFDAELKDLQIQAGKERQERQKDYNTQLNEIRIQADRARRDRQIAYDRELEAAQRQYDRQLKQIEANLTRQTNAYEQAGKNGANAGSGNGRDIGGLRAPNPTIGSPPSGGGIGINRTSISNTTIGGANISFQITGNNPQAIGAQVREEMRKVFRVKP